MVWAGVFGGEGLLTIAKIISETQLKKSPNRCIDLSSRSASRLQVCLSSRDWRCDSATCSRPCIQHKDAKDVCTFLFFFSPKWSSLHKGLVNPFKYAQQTQKCVMLTSSLVTYNIFSPNRCLQKLLRQVTSAPGLRGVCVQKNMISNPH